jgi:Icc-related predicted phosphoesterase
VDVSSRGQSLGSQAVLNAIVAKQPLLNVCGHIHGSAGRQAIIGATTVINAGPAGVIFDLATLQAGHA